MTLNNNFPGIKKLLDEWEVLKASYQKEFLNTM